MKRFAIVTLLLLIQNLLGGQSLHKPFISDFSSLGAYSIYHSDVFSFTNNQASLAQMTSTSAGIFSERKFLLNELNYYLTALCIVTKSGNFGLRNSYSGFAGYNEMRTGVAYARKLGSKIDLGIQFNYNSINIPGYGKASIITVETGSTWHLSDKLHTGFHIEYPALRKFGKEQQETWPVEYDLGIGYEASTKFLLSLIVEKQEGQPVNVNAGFQYKITEPILISAGMISSTSSFWFGFGYKLKELQLNLVSGFHPQLGYTPALSLSYSFKKKN